MMAIATATHTMGWHKDLSYWRKLRIAKAACNLFCYDLGYAKVTGERQLSAWIDKIDNSLSSSNSVRNVLKNKHKGKISYTDRITATHPEFLHNIWRYATTLLGQAATFPELAESMNLKSATEEGYPTLRLNQWSLSRWFKTQGGREKKNCEKPYLSAQQKVARVEFANVVLTMIAEGKIICYLDEKWMYLNSRRKLLKFLPRAMFEADGVERLQIRKVISRRHPIKVMFMGVVTMPDEERDFDGKISMIRVSREKELDRDSHPTKFHDDRHINDQIKQGEWRMLYADNTYTFDELIALIVNEYNMDEEMEARLRFRYITHVGVNRRKKYVALRGNDSIAGRTYQDETGIEHELTINDVVLTSFLPPGTLIEQDCSCDSRFMLQTMPTVGAAIRQKMPWVPAEETIYLVMDNAGGHGTETAIDEYTADLLEQFNVQIVHQAPRSPEVNALDLGLWMSLQSRVEKQHYDKTSDADTLAKTVNEAWNDLPITTITSVFNRIPIVQNLIVEHRGDNDLVETRRGMIHAPPED